ncbi:MAG: ferredoxin [bacterium]|nr:ferredoxin [bacterium]
MYIKISDKCTGCGVCSAINNEIFNVSRDTVIVDNDKVDGFEDDCIDAALTCPKSAILIDDD